MLSQCSLPSSVCQRRGLMSSAFSPLANPLCAPPISCHGCHGTPISCHGCHGTMHTHYLCLQLRVHTPFSLPSPPLSPSLPLHHCSSHPSLSPVTSFYPSLPFWSSVVTQHFTFVLTDLESKYRFGHCLYPRGANRCYCFFSHLPWFEFFYQLLDKVCQGMKDKVQCLQSHAKAKREMSKGMPTRTHTASMILWRLIATL